MSEALLRVESVSVRFGGLQALDQVSFEVRRGEILALIGPNGAGKSTLLNVVSGALLPAAGQVHLRDIPLVGLGADRVNALGLARTFQGAEILRSMSVRENVIAAGVARCGAGIIKGLVSYGPARAAYRQLHAQALTHLQAVGLEDLADQPAATLSAGQQRLLAIARALGTGAELLILDEPGAGLNATEKSHLSDVIHCLQAAGKTIVFVEHDLGFVGRLAERMVVLDHGKVIAWGAPEAVRSDPGVIEAYLGNTQVTTQLRTPANDADDEAPVAKLLEVDALVVRYSGAIALDGVSLKVAHGEIVAIVGANGAGKTTLLMALAGSVRPSGGKIVFDGETMTNLPAADRVMRGLSLAPEGRQLFGALTVGDNLLIGRYGRRRAAGLRELLWASMKERDEAAEILDMVYSVFPRLRERAAQPAGTLSGGEGQMLAIARALMNRPRLLMLDEPSFGLAPQVAREILEALPRLCASGLAILLIEQNARAALQISSRASVFANGRVVAQGTSQALLDDPDIARAYLGWDGEDAVSSTDLEPRRRAAG